jgi:hypothetical protein
MNAPRTIGWLVDELQRVELLQQFPALYPNVVAHHVTLASLSTGDLPEPVIGEIVGVADDGEGVQALHVTLASKTLDPLPQPVIGEIVGIADDDQGVQALVVSIGGTTDRPDGSSWHITWSLAEGRSAKESNDVIAARSWEAIELPVPVTLHPSDL